jgi:hypothetical protein
MKLWIETVLQNKHLEIMPQKINLQFRNNRDTISLRKISNTQAMRGSLKKPIELDICRFHILKYV